MTELVAEETKNPGIRDFFDLPLFRQRFVRRGELRISKAQWSELNRRYERERVIDILSKLIDDLPMPLRKISEGDAVRAFEALRQLETRKILKGNYIDINYTG